MHDLSRDPTTPEPSPTESAPTHPEVEHPGQRTETELCTLCDIVNDTFVSPRAFVLTWRLAGDGE